MAIIDFFKTRQKTTAQTAKERLQVIVAHQRTGGAGPADYLQKMQADILDVIRKYVDVDEDAVKVELDRDGELELLELNITLPESKLQSGA